MMFGANTRTIVFLGILIWGFLSGCGRFLWSSEVGATFLKRHLWRLPPILGHTFSLGKGTAGKHYRERLSSYKVLEYFHLFLSNAWKLRANHLHRWPQILKGLSFVYLCHEYLKATCQYAHSSKQITNVIPLFPRLYLLGVPKYWTLLQMVRLPTPIHMV